MSLPFITAGTRFSAQTRTPRFSRTVKRKTLHSREILFPENHILSPSLSLSGICAKTESFSDGCAQTQLFWTGFQCHCCNNLTAQQCGCNSPSLGFQEKAVFTAPHTCTTEGKLLSPHLQEGNSSATHHALPKPHHYELYFGIRDSIPSPS